MANRATMVDPDGGTTTYSYDARNGLASLVNPLQEITTWQYDAVGRIVTMTHANGSLAAHTYNGAGWLTQLVNAKSDGTTITSHDYSYDAVGNPTLMVEATGYRFTWTYDALNQLAAERGRAFSAFSITYSYDPVGNRLTKLQSGVTTTYTYDAGDELTLEDAAGELTTYAYDENGNTLLINAAGERTTLTWGYEDEALVIHAPEHVPVTMTYNGDHMRRRRQDANAVINYLWDGAQAFIETQSQDATLARYTLAPFGYGDLVSQRRSNETRFYHFDALGSTRALSDSAEGVSDTYAFEAFGKRIATSGASTNVYQWVGRLGYLGEGRLEGYYVRRRYYRYGVGRWVSRDPANVAGPDVYGYVGSGPLVYADPQGALPLPNCLSACAPLVLFPLVWAACMVYCLSVRVPPPGGGGQIPVQPPVQPPGTGGPTPPKPPRLPDIGPGSSCEQVMDKVGNGEPVPDGLLADCCAEIVKSGKPVNGRTYTDCNTCFNALRGRYPAPPPGPQALPR